MAGELRATILATVKGDAVKKLQKELGSLGDSLKTIGGTVNKVAKGFAGFATAIGATKFITGSIEQAKLLEQSYRSLETVFGPLTSEMQKFAEGATKIGLSQTEAAKASIFIGGVLQQYGVSTEKAAESTQKLVSLAADLSFVYGYDVQEALLGMTALFRGEYDPIEKFGVAMKQNEIESIKAARGLEHLTGAAEMNADVLIRQELLFQRTGKSLGAFTDNADTLAVQSEVMRATFENLQATIGQELTPVITQFYSDLIPIIEEAGPSLVKIIDLVVVVIKELARTFLDIFDPTTELGESVAGLIVQFDELGKTIFGKDFAFIAGVFDVARYVLDLFIRAITDLLYIIQSIIIEFQALGTIIKAVFEQDWDTVAKGVQAISRELHAAKDAAIAAGNAMAKFAQAEEVAAGYASLPDFWNMTGSKAAAAGVDAGNKFGEAFGDGAKGGAKDPIKEFYAGLQEDIAKQSARLRLTSMGASEGLVDAIMGSGQGWKKVFDNIVKGGLRAIQNAQSLFSRTSAGIKEIEEGAKKAKEALDKIRDVEIDRAKQMSSSQPAAAAYYDAYANMLEAGYSKEEAIQVAREEYAMALDQKIREQEEQQRALANTFTQTANQIFESFNKAGVVEELGLYTSAVRDLKSELLSLIDETQNEDSGSLFNKNTQEELMKSVTEVTGLLETVSRARDGVVKELDQTRESLEAKIGERKSLLQSVVDSIMGGVNITQIGGRATSIIRSLQKTLAQTKAFAQQVTQLRAMGLAGSAIDQIIQAGAVTGGATARALIAGGSKSIAEINGLYEQIGSVATQLGTEAADSMYGSGIKALDGLVEGLLSQQSELERTAEYLGNAFKNAFDTAVGGGMLTITSPGYDAIYEAIVNARNLESVATNAPIRGGGGSGTFNITVNAGLGTNGQSVGQLIVDEIKRFERQSGKVFISA
jgi:hypothetical protein